MYSNLFQILIPPKNVLESLKNESEDYHKVLEQVKYRVDWTRYQEMQKRKEEEALERERGKNSFKKEISILEKINGEADVDKALHRKILNLSYF